MERLKQLTSLSGVSGSCKEVRDYIINEIKCDFYVDAKGNVIAYKKGKKSDKKLMALAHMDEVGLIISEITDDGYLKFKCCGGIDERVLVSKRFIVGKGIKAVAAQKAVHLQTKSEIEAPPSLDDIVLDIGAKDKIEAEKYVKIGDKAVFENKFFYMGEDKFSAKALDDRVGCECLLRLLEKDFDYDFYGVFTTCEETVGIAAKSAAERIKPDMALVLEGTICSDVYMVPKKDFVTRLGDGVSIPFMDRTMIADKTMVDFLIKIADENKIKWQYKKTTAGGTDGGVVHTSAGGIRCAILALPVRYIHSQSSVADKNDLNAFFELADKFTERAGELL